MSKRELFENFGFKKTNNKSIINKVNKIIKKIEHRNKSLIKDDDYEIKYIFDNNKIIFILVAHKNNKHIIVDKNVLNNANKSFYYKNNKNGDKND